MIQNQRGVTLIELLVTIAILSFIGVLIWGVLIQGTKFSEKSMSKNTIQQEANLIITNLTKIHQTSTEYELSTSACKITVIATKEDSATQPYEFVHQDLCFSINQIGVIDPNAQDINMKLTVYETKDPSNIVEVDTILYRLKDGGY